MKGRIKMHRSYRKYACLVTTAVFLGTLGGCRARGPAEPLVVRLWPAGVPGEAKVHEQETYEDGRIAHVHQPTLEVYLPPAGSATGAAVVICPGGGYHILAIDKEGRAVARWLNSLGVAGIVLKNRLYDYGHPAPLMDAQQALATVRRAAEAWGIDTGRIGIMGFSAGGHLAATAGTHFDDPVIEGEIGLRPDFMILIYPVISMQDGITHLGSRRNLLGEDPLPELVHLMSNETQVTSETPPTFIAHANDDATVPVENALRFYMALRREGVPAAMHIFEEGGHGFGLGVQGAVTAWPDLCAAWLKERGLLD